MTTPPISARGPQHRRALLTVLAAMIGVSSVSGVWAAAAADASATTASAPASPSGVRTYRLTLKELGAQYPLNLAGVDGTNGVPFGVRADEIVTAARVSLNYAYSPALLPDLSHINVMVNGEVAHSIPVPKEDAGKSLKTDIDLPVRLITDFNRLNLQLIGHYSMGCEDPLHSSLWANVANDSVLELTVAPLRLQNDLALLPLPFFDRRDVRPLNLPFVMVGQPDHALLEAAGTLSSWFGALASYRGARFPVSLDALPATGNAVVLLAGTATLPGMNLPAAQAPTISLQPNPNDPMGKLLVIAGRDAAQVKTAAAALALGTQALSGQTATIVKFDTLAPRTPYDAPNWVRSDRPVKFGELAASRDLNVAGYRPDIVRVNLRLPPDLFALRDKGVPVDLKYRYTPRPSNDKSTLNVNVNRDFLQSIPLKSVEQLGGSDSLVGKLLSDETLPADKRMQIPLFMLPPRSQMQLHYYYDYLKQG
ncbi:MAG: cellulose biosynthesis cyclic di-GMP-binding regulatory protein BcsB, partial [Achromobacter sp.]